MKTADKIREQFLRKFCPNADLIRKAAQHYWKLGDIPGGRSLFRSGDEAKHCWLIIDGRVEIKARGKLITERKAGELIGEQAFLQRSIARPIPRLLTADIRAGGTQVTFWRIGPDFEANLNAVQKVVWEQTLAAVVNKKLAQAIADRLKLIQSIEKKVVLLDRFTDDEALDLVRTAVYEGKTTPKRREAIVWFSDIANFSKWSESYKEDPGVIADLVRTLAEIQSDLIGASGGFIDKFMGDGLMAIWFIDGHLEKSVPRKAVECAQKVASRIEEVLTSRELAERLDIRIGMHCGTVAFGDFGAKRRIAVTVLGDIVNLASRYESAKDQSLGRIRVSPKLKGLVEKCPGKAPIQFSDCVTVKAKHERDIDVFCVLAE